MAKSMRLFMVLAKRHIPFVNISIADCGGNYMPTLQLNRSASLPHITDMTRKPSNIILASTANIIKKIIDVAMVH